MTWFGVDDKLFSHPKVRSAGLEAMGLWAIAGSHCAAYVTEGAVPTWLVSSWPKGFEAAATLVCAGLWDESAGGWQFHDWDHYQPTKDQVDAKRVANRDRQQRWRDAKAANKARNAVTNTVSNGVGNASRNASPSPFPSTQRKELSSALPSREDVELLCKRLAEHLANRGVARHEITSAWRTQARLLLDSDGRELDKALRLIDWCQADAFWSANILSMPKFREKYEQLRLKANADAARPLRVVTSGEAGGRRWQE